MTVTNKEEKSSWFYQIKAWRDAQSDQDIVDFVNQFQTNKFPIYKGNIVMVFHPKQNQFIPKQNGICGVTFGPFTFNIQSIWNNTFDEIVKKFDENLSESILKFSESIEHFNTPSGKSPRQVYLNGLIRRCDLPCVPVTRLVSFTPENLNICPITDVVEVFEKHLSIEDMFGQNPEQSFPKSVVNQFGTSNIVYFNNLFKNPTEQEILNQIVEKYPFNAKLAVQNLLNLTESVLNKGTGDNIVWVLVNRFYFLHKFLYQNNVEEIREPIQKLLNLISTHYSLLSGREIINLAVETNNALCFRSKSMRFVYQNTDIPKVVYLADVNAKNTFKNLWNVTSQFPNATVYIDDGLMSDIERLSSLSNELNYQKSTQVVIIAESLSKLCENGMVKSIPHTKYLEISASDSCIWNPHDLY